MRGSFIAAAFLSAATLSAGSAQTAPARGPAGKQPSAQIAAPQDKAMLDAFRRVYGAAPPVKIKADGHDMSAAPAALIPLSATLTALIVKETNAFDAHGAEAATSVVYLRRNAAGVEALQRFEHIAWAGENGGAETSYLVRRDLGAAPFILMRGETSAQGERRDDAAIIRLDPDKPKAMGWINLLEDNQDDGGGTVWSYRGEIVPATAPAVLAVRYQGWTARGEKAPHKPFNRTVAFTVRSGCIVPVRAAKLPDGELSARPRPQCKIG